MYKPKHADYWKPEEYYFEIDQDASSHEELLQAHPDQ